MWKIRDRKIKFESPYVRFVEKQVETDQGVGDFATFEYPDFCNVVPVTEDGHIVLVRQLRVGIEQYTLEVPGGCIDANDPDPKASALRELREETGYALTDAGRVEFLGWTYPNPATQNNRCHLYVAGPVRKVGLPDNPPQEETEVFLSPIEAISDAIRNSTLTHALMLNAFLFLHLNARRNGFTLEEELARFTRAANRRP